MTIRIEGFAIISEDGMLADASGIMPPALVIEADQKFLSDGLDRASVIIHGRNSHENQPHSPQRRRLIASRSIKSISPISEQPNAFLWNPDKLSLDQAVQRFDIRLGIAAILGGTEIYGLFLPRYDVFHLSRVPEVRLPGGRPVFPQVPKQTPETVLASVGMKLVLQKLLDPCRQVELSMWCRG